MTLKKSKSATDSYKNKKIFNINDIDVSNILVPKKEKYDKYNSYLKMKSFLKITIKYGKKLKN